jgi:predicted restriction endonuclease
LDEQLFLLPEDLAQLEDEEEATILQAATTGSGLYEGADMRILVNRYERNAKARQACLAHYGHTCFGCGFNFQQFYGSLAAGASPTASFSAEGPVPSRPNPRPAARVCQLPRRLTPAYSSVQY